MFLGDRDSSYDRFRPAFLSAYFKTYAEFRRSEVSLQFEDISSIVEFINRKTLIYETVEELSSQQAIERVFYELPVSICEEFVLRKSVLNKESLISFVTYSDFIINAHYRLLNERFNESQINDSNRSATRLPVPGRPATQPTAIDLNDHRIFFNLDSDAEDDLGEEEEGTSDGDGEMDLQVDQPVSVGKKSRRKRRNSKNAVPLRKDNSEQSRTKKRR